MRMTIRILIPFLFVSQISLAQTSSIDCAKTLNQELLVVKYGKDSLPADIKILQQCGRLDSTDAEIFLSTQVLGSLIFSLQNDHKQPTYSGVLNLIDQFKKSPGYHKYRAERTPDPLETSPASYKLETEPFVDVGNSIKKSKSKNKKVLIYFTALSSANARRMEQTVLSDDKVLVILSENYVVFNASVDDNTKLNSATTTGRKNLKIQQEKFKQGSQPYFVVVDYSGKVLAESGYTNNVKGFTDFLNKGLSAP
jgi:thioredoxin-related protein